MSDALLVSTRKGLFDISRTGKGWTIHKTAFLGDNVTLAIADPRDGSWYAALNLGHFGVKLQRSDDHGASWTEVAVPAFGPEHKVGTGDGKEIRLARVTADAPLLAEIGRLRERTFREVGEGTGRSRDVDACDPDYEHILVWDAAAMRIAGAYRIARGASLLARRGLAGLYTASLFHYTDEALPRIAQGLELGRSFVVPEYWGTRSLDYLWQGIGAYLRRHPQVRYLFGAVSISAALPREAREHLVAYYDRYYGAGDAAAAALRPFCYIAAPPDFGDLDAETAFGVLRANLAAHGATVPVLYKQYTELCEPGGARFLAFGVDPDFSDSIDGLIEVDLQTILPKKRQRYLQARETIA